MDRQFVVAALRTFLGYWELSTYWLRGSWPHRYRKVGF